MKHEQRKVTTEEREKLLQVLRSRFEANRHRHPGLDWSRVQARLEAHPEKQRSLLEMERTGGEHDVVEYDDTTGGGGFYGCPLEDQKGRKLVW